jgi:hypothetical protein
MQAQVHYRFLNALLGLPGPYFAGHFWANILDPSQLLIRQLLGLLKAIDAGPLEVFGDLRRQTLKGITLGLNWFFGHMVSYAAIIVSFRIWLFFE